MIHRGHTRYAAGQRSPMIILPPGPETGSAWVMTQHLVEMPAKPRAVAKSAAPVLGESGVIEDFVCDA